jgi:hypothetical protein
MPQRADGGEPAFRMLWTDRSLLRLDGEGPQDLFASLGCSQLDQLRHGELSSYRWNIAANLSTTELRLSGVEVYPEKVDSEQSWRELAASTRELCGWDSEPQGFLESWFRHWSVDDFTTAGPSHLVGSLAAARSEVGDARFVVSPSHIKLSPRESGGWSAKSYLRFECHA